MPAAVDNRGFKHEAFFYADREELLAGAVPFLRAGLHAQEAILVAMPARNLALLRGELGSDAEGVRFLDMERVGRNPARIISTWRDFVDAQPGPTGGVRGIGEPVWSGRSPAELDECMRHESLLNLAFVDSPAWSLLCPYDTAALDASLLEDAERNHPYMHDAGEARASDAYGDPCESEGPFAGALGPPADVLGERSFQSDEELSDVRGFLATRAGEAGLETARLGDLVLAASEVATNSLLHGGGRGTLRVWRDRDRVGCDVRDRGHIKEPLVGRRRPAATQISGRGLWLANQLCDLVQIRSSVDGTLVRLHMLVHD